MSLTLLLGQTKPAPVVVDESPRPLVQLQRVLQSRYGKPVMLEETFLEWRGETAPLGDKGDIDAKPHSFVIPAQTPEVGVKEAAQHALDAYHQKQMGPRYKVIETPLGIDLIPDQVRNASGVLQHAVVLLDAKINIPIESRTPAQHFRALEAAISKATGVRLPYSGIDPRLFDRHFSVDPVEPFEWGAENQIARDALVNLLGRSATSYSWGLSCRSSTKPENRFCVLNIREVLVAKELPDGKTKQQMLEWDRCPACDSRDKQ